MYVVVFCEVGGRGGVIFTDQYSCWLIEAKRIASSKENRRQKETLDGNSSSVRGIADEMIFGTGPKRGSLSGRAMGRGSWFTTRFALKSVVITVIFKEFRALCEDYGRVRFYCWDYSPAGLDERYSLLRISSSHTPI